MSDREASSPVTESISSPDPPTTKKNSLNHISEENASGNEENNMHSHETILWTTKSSLSENYNATEETYELEGFSQGAKEADYFQQSGDQTNGLFHDWSVCTSHDYIYNESDKKENPLATQPLYIPSYMPRIEKNWLKELDETDDDDEATESRNKRVKCLQIIVLGLSAVVLSTVVIYFGSEPTETLRNIG